MRPTVRALFSVAQLPGALRLARPWHGIWPDGSVVRIRAGLARGLAWRRHHRYGPSFWMGTHQPHVQNALARLLEPGMRVFDMSAHAGFFSVAAGRLVGPTGHVLAVEPHPEHVESIRAQAALNHDLPIDVVACRVGERAGLGTMLFLRHGLPIGDAPFLGKDVEVRTIDGLVREHGRPHVVRLDVDGAECDVLRGAAFTLASRVPRGSSPRTASATRAPSSMCCTGRPTSSSTSTAPSAPAATSAPPNTSSPSPPSASTRRTRGAAGHLALVERTQRPGTYHRRWSASPGGPGSSLEGRCEPRPAFFACPSLSSWP